MTPTGSSSSPPLVVLLAPQALKGTMGPRDVARYLAQGVAAELPQARTIELPVADGGDGLIDAVLPPGERRDSLEVTGPIGGRVAAEIGWLDVETAVVECASACGLRLLTPPERDPLRTTSRGVGELLQYAVLQGARRVYVGLGGSATVDGGTGMARALGWRFLDARGASLPEGGGSLPALASVERPPPLEIEVIGLADVSHPLVGSAGAAVTFAPQKGAGPDAVAVLARGLERLAAWARTEGRPEIAELPGGGAAGGLAAGLCLFAGGRLEPGAEWVLARVGFDEVLRSSSLVLTAEGEFDATSLRGKATGEVLRRAATAGVAAGVIAGRVEAVHGVAAFCPEGNPELSGATLVALARRATRTLLSLPPA